MKPGAQDADGFTLVIDCDRTVQDKVSLQEVKRDVFTN